MRQSVIFQNSTGFTGYGAIKALWKCRDHEVIISGPYETGKTFGGLQKFNALLAKYPGCHALMVRKTYNSLLHSAIVTYETKVLPFPPLDSRCTVRKFGGEKPEWFDYPNGSRLVCGGMDRVEKFQSAEFDFIYVNQAEEITLDEWEKLSMRCTGRAGNADYPQIIGDCNPSTPSHWILKRAKSGALTLLESRHQDNPALYEVDMNTKRITNRLTAQGERTMAKLKTLSGVRKKRGGEGLWVAAEGIVYPFDPAIHMITPAAIGEKQIHFHRYIGGVDWGYTNPGVIQIWGVDSDDRIYRVSEIYQTQKQIGWWAAQAKRLDSELGVEVFVCDPCEPSYIAQFIDEGMNAMGADNAILPGIDAVQSRMTVQEDGRPRLFLVYDALETTDSQLSTNYLPTCTEEEFPGYVYPPSQSGKNDDEKPIKHNDHGLDATRYVCRYLSSSDDIVLGSFLTGGAAGWGF